MENLEKFPFLASFIAGIFTFISPCVLPLIPAFISFITGASIEDLRDYKTSLRHSLFKSLVFVSGFSLIFIIMGLSASWLGGLLSEHRDWLRYAGGAVVIVFGLHMSGLFRIRFLYRQASASGKIKSSATWIGTFFVGAAFALGWTPCVGPILSSILILASTQGSAVNGFWLLTVYSLGLGVPFVLTSVFINRFLRFFNFIKNYYKIIEIVSGILLIAVGILIITNGMTKITEFILKIISN
ncbi:MAG: cytochrome c biogenesis protein CcdA [Endomicrobium sp.]|jgi:cytochrome c-type biogenesis protein|nr:cytochrome c biogenesis protein CcdA [Endomicrobium sp.]